jgi:hypothetical protein
VRFRNIADSRANMLEMLLLVALAVSAFVTGAYLYGYDWPLWADLAMLAPFLFLLGQWMVLAWVQNRDRLLRWTTGIVLLAAAYQFPVQWTISAVLGDSLLSYVPVALTWLRLAVFVPLLGLLVVDLVVCRRDLRGRAA